MSKLAELKAKLAAGKSSAPAPAPKIPAPAPTPAPENLPALQTGEAFTLQEKVASLSEALLSRHPRMPTLLREIHTALREQPENVTLLNEEQIATIVNGLKVQTGVEFAATATSKPSATKSLKAKVAQLGLDAF